MLVLIIFLIPLLVNARITVNITVHTNKSNLLVNVTYIGNDDKVVTNEELKLFNITNARLNKGMKVEIGKEPRNIFLKNPTPHGDLFKKFKWKEMTRRLTVKKFKIIDIIKEDIVLDTHEHINNATSNIISKKTMFKVMDNSVSSTWFKEGLPKDEIFTNFTLDFGYGKFKYVNKWRNESTRTTKLPIGVTEDGHIAIKPGQHVVTELIATKLILLIELEYKAQLVGSIVANFVDLYGSHHYWAPAVKNIMEAGKMKNEVLTREMIEVRCFGNPRLRVYVKLGSQIESRRKKRPQMKVRNKNMLKNVHIKSKNLNHTQKKSV